LVENLSSAELKQRARQKAYEYEKQFHGCSQAVFLAFQELLDLQDDLAFRAAGPLCAGLGMGKTCGSLAGGVMVLGMRCGRSRIEEGLEGLVPGLLASQQLVGRFEQVFGTTSCSEISKVNWADPDEVTKALADPELVERCALVAGRTAEMVAELLASEM